MASWLLKTESSTYSWDDLVKAGKTRWDGVTNPAALIAIRQMRAGDEALIYHSGAERALVGIAKITRGAYQDPASNDPRRAVVDLAPVRPLKAPVTLSAVKAEPTLAEFALVRNSRLSTMPVEPAVRRILTRLGVR
ncbi:MAG: EVE domain-containing protein [Gemmatimonadales bacterium]|nr:EVE domain-containing protein [Gemmatimonadales bacterium]